LNWTLPKNREPRGNPMVAAILTWLLPGAGHIYLGLPVVGLLGFLVVQGVYFLGLQLSGGMLFEYLEPDLRGPGSSLLSPEIGNLGALIYHIKQYGYGPGWPRPWPPMMELGAWLTAASGMLNICLMVRAHGDARSLLEGSSELPGLARLVLLAWALPGLGHWLQGRKARALVWFGLLVGMLVLGSALAEGSNLSRERHFFYWAGQFLSGLPNLGLQLVFGSARVAAEQAYADAGLDLGCLAGLLNVLAMIDVYTHGETRALERDSAAATGNAGAAGNAASASSAGATHSSSGGA